MIDEGLPALASQPVKVAVIGLGYVGLPLALLFENKGFEVFGIDVDKRKIHFLNEGRSYLPDLSDVEIQSSIGRGRFHAGTEFEKIGEAEAVIICVPTPLTPYHTPDLSFLQNAARAVGEQLQLGQVVILESSTYPGTTREVLCPILEKTSGLRAGKDFYIGYSPERIDPGNKTYTVEKIPKLVSGLTGKCVETVDGLYSRVFQQVVRVSSLEIAEMAKIVENSQRLVNITFANELALICDQMNIDVWEVIDAAATKPFGFTAYYPGPGIGGHCIPVDPLYLQWKSKAYGMESKFIGLSENMNRSMPRAVVDRIFELLARHGEAGIEAGGEHEDVGKNAVIKGSRGVVGEQLNHRDDDQTGARQMDVEQTELVMEQINADDTQRDRTGAEQSGMDQTYVDQTGMDQMDVEQTGGADQTRPDRTDKDQKVAMEGLKAGQGGRKRPYILIYGVAYKKDVNDVRESPALELIPMLMEKGAYVEYHDPYIDEIRLGEETFRTVELTEEKLASADCVVIITDHTGLPVERIVKHAKLVFDTRNATAGWKKAPHVFRFGGGEGTVKKIRLKNEIG